MNPREKPILVYDGRCAFCRLWIERWKTMTGDSVAYETSAGYAASVESAVPTGSAETSGHAESEISAETSGRAATPRPVIPAEEFRKGVVLIRPDGTYLTGALAVFTTLQDMPAGRLALILYKRLAVFGRASERLYRTVSAHRDELYPLTRVLWGKSVVAHGYASTGWIFLRGIALVYAIAFASLYVQVPGLVGSKGISPAAMFLEAVHARFGAAGALYYPTLAWIDPGDGALTGLCLAGMACSGLLFAGIAPRISAIACWALYFSLAVAGQVFLRFQWDSLLLEAGLLTIFFAPGGMARILPGDSGPPRAARWLVWLLVFRLMLMSGVTKLSAGDPNWWNLTALSYHYQTQCLPNPAAWHAHWLPLWFHKASAFLMFMVEIGAPFLLITPRRLRHLGALMLIGLQAAIMVTGNFAFFNLLAIVLCISLLDDALTRPLIPRFLRRRVSSDGARPSTSSHRRPRAPVLVLVSLMLILNFNQLAGLVVPRRLWPSPVAAISAWASHFHIVDGYGLFRVVTTKRPEIIIEGSDDRVDWKPYGFLYKPDDVSKPLPWVAPHQPRLDWQMWFAALGNFTSERWLENLAIRLLEGSPDVLALMGHNPFPGRPPVYIRALLYEYRFTPPAVRESTGAVWERTLNSVYMPPLSLSGS